MVEHVGEEEKKKKSRHLLYCIERPLIGKC